jgi:glycosyltransferase involved in cell wall biosynthesis
MPTRLKINFFSPLPPLPTDIGNHTLHVAPELADRADITLWSDQANWDTRIEQIAPVRRFDPNAPPVREMNCADANVYNLGNNAVFQSGIFNISQQAPGIVVLHDTRLQHFFAALARTDATQQELYLDRMWRAHGEEAAVAARGFLASELPFEDLVERYPLTLAMLDRAVAAVVHNPEAYQALHSQTRVPLYLQPLCFPADVAPQRPSSSRSNPTRLVVFGFIGFNRRIASILEALAGMPNREQFHLDIYGRMEDQRLVDEPIARFDLGNLVECHGFVDERTLDAALLNADLALNLRYPSMGEASGSQLRIWRAALPSLVTRTDWYATLPDDAVFFVEPAAEIESIRAHLASLYQNPERFVRAGWRGRQILEKVHSPAQYAMGLIDIAAAGPAQHARRQAIDLAYRVAKELLYVMDAPKCATVAQTVAEAIRDLVAPSGRL